MITAAKLAARAGRRLELLVHHVAGDPMLKDCRTPRCVSCRQCRELSPLTQLPWAVLHARARGRSASHVDEDGALVPDIELLEGEVTEAGDRAFVAERTRQLAAFAALGAQWEREEREQADRERVAVVAARRSRTAEARRRAADRRRKRKIAA